MPRSERRDRKTCLCWKAFTLTHLYKDIKKNPSTLRAGRPARGGEGGRRQSQGPRCPRAACEVRASPRPLPWPSPTGPTARSWHWGGKHPPDGGHLPIDMHVLSRASPSGVLPSALDACYLCDHGLVYVVSVPSAGGAQAPRRQAFVLHPQVLQETK